jgi:oligopeptide transport system substrate-binding protein
MKGKMLKNILLIILFFFISCQSQTKTSCNIVRLNIVDQPQSLDPRKARDLSSITIMKMLFEGLMRVSKDGKVESSLADKVLVSEDGKTYTFKLKKSFWTNDEKITSYDFSYSWKKTLNPSFVSSMAYQLYIIKGAKEAKEGKISLDQVGIKTPDDSTLVVELTNPTSYFLELLAQPVFFPVFRDIDEKDSMWSQNIKSFISNGPFCLEVLKPHNVIELKKNEKYFENEVVKIKKISLVMISSEKELDLFENNELDWAGSPFSTIPLDALSFLKKREDFYIASFWGTYFLRVNTKKIDDKTFRKNLFQGLDRQSIVENILQGGQKVAFSLVPIDMRLGKTIQNFKKDFSKNKNSITLTHINNDRQYLLAQVLQGQWSKSLGLNVKLEALETKIFYDRIYSGKYELAIGSWTADFADPINFLEVFKFKDSSTNNTFWENQRYRDLLDEASTYTNENKRKKVLREAEDILINDVPIIPIFHLSMNYLKKPGLKNVYLSPMGHMDLKWAYTE